LDVARTDRAELINRALGMIGSPTTYVEIGVRFGATFRQIRATAKLGVEPGLMSRKHRLAARLSGARSALGQRRGELLFSTTSDEFFAKQGRLLRRLPPNVVLVDGLHTADQSYRDVTNSLDRLHTCGMVVLHDCNPRSQAAAAATPDEATRHPGFDNRWNGEVWRTVVRLRSERPDLRVCVLDCDEGLGLVARGTPDTTLDLAPRDIARLSYADLCADRDRLLNLRPPWYGAEFLAAALGSS
jgi:hypothetical protein